ncbi:XRE family transcriptional regulator [Kitasatospora sp. A2-31]|uniref:XRE family transcriptional regulator n=1 Tax=Kitasatospora sp. A2-31 TaxID=2916414 RepID=UPI001EEE4C32|nr:XRE family transcriptional regulator [Kitasatospora sp. A2-31]MCG6499220.1 XRE family transcriptional regulator [Kitasatospora sp. A2-31]
MTTQPTIPDLTARIGVAVKAARSAAGLSAPALAAACTELGVPTAANAVNKIETARRESIKLEEAIAFAVASGVPLVSLLVPLDGEAEVDLLPNLRLPVWEAATLITGEDYSEDAAPEDRPRAVLTVFREHAIDVRTALISTREARDRRSQAAHHHVGSDRYQQLSRQAAEFERIATEDCQRLRDTRARMRAQGLHPAPLPAALAFIAPDEQEDTT